MQLTNIIRELGRNDVKLVGRDSFLVVMFSYIFAMSIGLRFGLPWFADELVRREVITFDLAVWYPMMVAFIAVFMGAMMAGMIFGFLLLDEKDDNTIKAMLVTPLPINHYIAYRVGVPAVLGFFTIIIEMLIINQSLPELWQLILIALGGSLTAPITTLFFAAFAENKVQGFAMTKFTGLAGMIIIFSWFIDEPIQFLFGLFPPYWISKAYWMALEGNALWIASLLAGIILQAALIALLARRFNQIVYR